MAQFYLVMRQEKSPECLRSSLPRLPLRKRNLAPVIITWCTEAKTVQSERHMALLQSPPLRQEQYGLSKWGQRNPPRGENGMISGPAMTIQCLCQEFPLSSTVKNERSESVWQMMMRFPPNLHGPALGQTKCSPGWQEPGGWAWGEVNGNPDTVWITSVFICGRNCKGDGSRPLSSSELELGIQWRGKNGWWRSSHPWTQETVEPSDPDIHWLCTISCL